MSQTSVAEQAVGQVGQKVDSGFDDNISRVAEGDVPFGRFVSLGTLPDRQAILPAAAGDVTDLNAVLGVAIRSQAVESNDFPSGSGDPRYLDKQTMSVMRTGRVWMIAEDAVTPLSDVFVRHTAGNEGAVRSDADTANAAQIPKANARFLTSAGAGELVQLEISL